MGLDGGEDFRREVRGRAARAPIEDELEAAFLERTSLGVLRFGDAVAVEHEEIAGGKDGLDRAVLRMVEQPEGDAGAFQALEAAVPPPDERREIPE